MFSGGSRGQEVAECDTCGSLAVSGSVAVSGRLFTDSIYNTMDQHWSLLPPRPSTALTSQTTHSKIHRECWDLFIILEFNDTVSSSILLMIFNHIPFHFFLVYLIIPHRECLS